MRRTKKTGDYIEYSSKERGRNCGGWIVAYLNGYVLIRDAEDNLKAIEEWRVK